MSDIECPLCGTAFEEGGAVIQDLLLEVPSEEWQSIECPSCEKPFAVMVEYRPVFRSHEAPCLRGGDHAWVPRFDGLKKVMYRCEFCGASKSAGSEDHALS